MSDRCSSCGNVPNPDGSCACSTAQPTRQIFAAPLPCKESILLTHDQRNRVTHVTKAGKPIARINWQNMAKVSFTLFLPEGEDLEEGIAACIDWADLDFIKKSFDLAVAMTSIK